MGIALLFWLLMIRPAQRRQQETAAACRRRSSVGDEVMLTSGIFGDDPRRVDDDRVSVEVADGVTIKVARGAIGTVVTEQPDDEPDETELDGLDRPTEPTGEER